jgi:hypothetical protein
MMLLTVKLFFGRFDPHVEVNPAGTPKTFATGALSEK